MAYRWNDYRISIELAKRLEELAADLTPQLGGYLDLNGQGFVVNLVAGVTVAAGELCYLASTGKMVKADASADATCRYMLAMATEAIAADATGVFLLRGYIDIAGLGTIGGVMYASETAGSISSSPAAVSGGIVRVIGYVITSTQLFFDPDRTWIELA